MKIQSLKNKIMSLTELIIQGIKSMNPELLKRWITALIALPILIMLIQWKVSFSILAATASAIGLWEYYSMFSAQSSQKYILSIIGLILALAMIWMAHIDFLAGIMGLIVLNLLIAAIISIFIFKNDPDLLYNISRQIMGIIYVPFLISYLMLIRNGEDGVVWIFWLLIMVFACDTGAFYVGKYMGKHKLCPQVSPGKTVEGFAGGLAACIICGIIFKFFFVPYITMESAFIISAVVGIIGPVGDLFESMLKRSSGVKDSGKLLPGHGGILDRIDALLFAAPVVYYSRLIIIYMVS
ncbi:phosphatidate cytidylyltransferase [Candidatus Magnetomoraceae bacterium gMMP-15]